MSTLKEDVENMKTRLREIAAAEVYMIQDKHGVGISRIDVEMLDCAYVGELSKQYVVGNVNVDIEV